MSKPMPVPFLLLAAPLALFLAGCSYAPASAGGATGRTVTEGERFAMRPGETVVLSDRSTLRYVSVTSDSRCPPDVQCIHAGNAVVGFEWRRAGGSMLSFELNSPEQPQSRDLGSLRLTLQSLAIGAAPQAHMQVERGH